MVAGCLALLGTGCTSSGIDVVSKPDPKGIPGPNASIEFLDDGTLALTPGELAELTVATSPPDRYEISFLLLGESLNASLDQTSVVADVDGLATVTLLAPDSSTTFRLRASITDGPSEEIAVSVSDEGFGTVRLIPNYMGARDVTAWTAAVVAHATCEEIASVLPDDPEGALVQSAPYGQNPEVPLAPVGPNLAVTLRAGHKMWGCTDETGLVAREVTEVKVNVIDKPLDLTTTDLALELAYAPDPVPYGTLLADAVALLASGVFPDGSTEATVLLDAMANLVGDPADAAALADARANMGLDGNADTYLLGLGTPVREVVSTWASDGLAAEPALITARLTSAGQGEGSGILSLEKLGNVDANAAGVPADHLVSWTAQPGDVVLLGGMLFWLPTRYAAATAFGPASTDFPGSASVSEALATLVDCSGFATAVGAFGTCDVTCVASLCEAGLDARWAVGVAQSAELGLIGTLDMAASGDAKVSDDATPVSFLGSWVGEVRVGGQSASVSGDASAELPSEPAQ